MALPVDPGRPQADGAAVRGLGRERALGHLSSKDVEAFVRRLRHAGLVVERSGGGHYKVMTPEGGTVAFLPFSPSTNRWRENTIAQLRKRGIVLEDDPHQHGRHDAP